MDRRKWMVGTLGAAALPTLTSASENANVPGQRRSSGPVRSSMPVLAKHEGTWEGAYTFVDLRGEVQDQYDFSIDVALSAEDRHAYQQTSRYRWKDGRKQELYFEAQHQEGQLVWDNGRIAGRMWQLDDRSLYLRFGFAAMPDVECFEMIQISEDGETRGRTWLWYRSQVLYQSVLVDERRIRA